MLLKFEDINNKQMLDQIMKGKNETSKLYASDDDGIKLNINIKLNNR